MTPYFKTVRTHYEAAIDQVDDLVARVERLIAEAGGSVGAEQLANLDQFHVGGLAATIDLARRASITADMQVLDAGSGLGGPSRWLAKNCGAKVTGVDLSPAYVAVSNLLARHAGLSQHVNYQEGSITALPFADGTFDLVWTQHVVMNIPDRAGLYRELRRVLKSGGRIAFYDPYLPDHGEPPVYPTPWAERAEASTLLTREATVAALEGAGFTIDRWDDVTDEAPAWSAGQRQMLAPAASTPGGPQFSLGLVMGPRMREMVQNFQRNMQERRLLLVMGLCTAT